MKTKQDGLNAAWPLLTWREKLGTILMYAFQAENRNIPK